MTNKEKLINTIIDGFQHYRGKASCYCFNKDVVPELVYSVVRLFLDKNKQRTVLIVVDNYATRVNIKTILDNYGITEANGYNYRIYSKDFVKTKYVYFYNLIITVGINSDSKLICHLAEESKFTLSIITENIMDNTFINEVRNMLPTISTGDLDKAIRYEDIYSPVEETRIGVELSAEDRENYDKCTKIITEDITIFGNIENIEKCKIGDTKLGISSAEFRLTLAKENGWSENLDTRNEFQAKVDAMYNPNVLIDKAITFYTLTKMRRDMCSDYNGKLKEILNIVNDNKDKRILIVSKRGEFAYKISKYLTENDIKCGNYHDCCDDEIAKDSFGNPIFIKSGANKGQPKIIKSQAISSRDMSLFNDGYINVLSIKNSSNTSLKLACDIVIITSSQCEDIYSIKTRFNNIRINTLPNKVYKLYCTDTIEEDKIRNEKINPNIAIIEKSSNTIKYDEESGDIIL